MQWCNSWGPLFRHRLPVGATAGAGIEWGFTPNMSAKLEYLYVTAASFELSHINVVRAGLNFRFGGL